MSETTYTFKILRYCPEKDDRPHFRSFDVPCKHETSILDALNFIRDHFDPDLSYRSSCRMAVCGSCAIMINRLPRLACKTFVREFDPKKAIALEPLDHFPIERDLITDISDMITKIESVQPYITWKTATADSKTHLQTPQQLEKYKQFAQCINCGCCYAACPQYDLNPDFIGPAALSLLYRYNHDSRDDQSDVRHKIMTQNKGVWRCTSVGFCSDVCPKLVDPASAIQINKEESAFDYIKFFFHKFRKKA